MAKGTDFGGVHSFRDLHLIQQKVEVQPAEPKLNLIDIPGADGSKDLSEVPAGRMTYKDRKISWTFALYPGENWADKHRQVSAALNGKRCSITLDEDQSYYYSGRLVVKQYTRERLLRQITVEATCAPYMLKQQATTITANLTTTYKSITLNNQSKPVIPTIEVTAKTTLRWKGAAVTVNAGTFTTLDIELTQGDNLLEAKTESGTGKITVTYREGSL